MLNGSGRRCAVLGSPVGHSLSPVLHRAAYRELGLDWRYDAVEITPDALRGWLDGLDPCWRGLSLTMPLKRAVMPLLDTASDTAATAGAANTVLREDDGSRRGHNTDVPGMVAALAEHGVRRAATATVLGGGATATSAVLALARLGCREVTLRVREPGRAGETVQAARRIAEPPEVRVRRLDDPEGAPEVDVLVSTVPVAAQTASVAALVERTRTVFDVVYDPWPTPLARQAVAARRTLVDGLDLLAHQATRQVELMTGCDRAPLEAMRAAGAAALGRGSA